MNRFYCYYYLGMFLCLLCPLLVLAHEKAEQEAVKAAQKWLKLVDQGQKVESWKEAALYFKNAVTQEQWSQSFTGVRQPLGEVISRELKTRQYTASLPGAPDGEYVVIQFNTTFEKKKTALETVTPMRDSDGTWRVAGYYIR